ncbi:MAG: hypothetical protein HYV17_00795 [Xanthomonadales bacterium]|nr:hypothetical protein [Xanthomonadales bacterium]
MAAPNYAFAKKQRELAKKKKNEEKLRKKTGKTEDGDSAGQPEGGAPQPPKPQGS